MNLGDRTERPGRPRSEINTLAHVVESLGSHTLSVLVAPLGLGAFVSGTVRYDRFESLPQGRGAMLFASGLRESDPGWPDLVGSAAVSGYCALVLKRWSGDTRLLVAAASAAKVALLTIPPQIHWHDLDALVNGVDHRQTALCAWVPVGVLKEPSNCLPPTLAAPRLNSWES